MNFALSICLMATLLGSALGSVCMCYLSSGSLSNVENNSFQISNIESELCTHYFYAFIGITAEGYVDILDEYRDSADNGGQNNIGKFAALKNTTTAPKVLISIGGWGAGSTNFTIVSNNASLRAKFVKEILAFLKKYQLDGLDMDWEYPAQREEGQLADKESFITFLSELKAAFVEEGFLLTAAVGADKNTALPSYNIPELSKYLDYIGVMTYDMATGTTSNVIGNLAPFLPAAYQANSASLLHNNVVAALNFWLDRGAPASKLVLGLPLYGRTFTLVNTSETTPGSASAVSEVSGSIGYNDLCEQQLNGNWTTVWYDAQQVPYTYSGNQWVGFDNERSLTIKTNYAKQLGLAGIMFWSIDTDDFRAVCGDTTYPLIKAAKAALVATTDA